MASKSCSTTSRIGLKMGNSRVAASVAALLILASASARAGGGEGIVLYDENKRTTLHTTAKLRVGDKVLMQYPGETGELLCCINATVTGKVGRSQMARSNDQVSDVLRKAKVLGYRLKLDNKKAFTSDFVAAAVIAPKLSVRQLSPVRLEIGTGPDSTKVESCLSQEGLHLINHKAGKVSTHLYLSAGYEVEPTCSDDVWKLLKIER
jgi:hypothetical protein